MCKFRRSCTVTFALFLALACFGEFGLAEPERGRLPDGRAFRTGTDGVQLVDYMAELELSIEELNRRVYGLEAEVKEKQERIDRFELTGKADAPLRERDLLGNTSGARSACPEPPPCPVCSATESGFREFDPELIRKERRCAVDLAGVRAELNRSQQQLAEARSALYVAEQRIAQERGTQGSADNQISQLRASFESRIAKLESEKTALLSELNNQKGRLAEGTTKSRSAMMPQATAALGDPKASLSVAALRSSAPQRPYAMRHSTARLQAINSMKSTLQSNLNQLRGLAAERDRKFREYGPQQGAVRFKPHALVSSRRYTIDMIKQGISAAQSMSELSVLDRDIRDIRNKVKDDISFIDRMKKRQS